MRLLAILVIAPLLGGCLGVPVVRVGDLANEQPPLAGPAEAWSARGRLRLALPGRVMSLTAYLRRNDGGELRIALIEDGGLMGCDVSYGASGSVIHHCRDELVSLLPVFAAMFHGAYTPAGPIDEMRWRTGRLQEDTTDGSRWYGGDPVTLGYVHSDSWPVTVGDYRVSNGLLVAHRVRADGPWGTELILELDTVTLGAAPPP